MKTEEKMITISYDEENYTIYKQKEEKNVIVVEQSVWVIKTFLFPTPQVTSETKDGLAAVVFWLKTSERGFVFYCSEAASTA